MRWDMILEYLHLTRPGSQGTKIAAPGAIAFHMVHINISYCETKYLHSLISVVVSGTSIFVGGGIRERNLRYPGCSCRRTTSERP